MYAILIIEDDVVCKTMMETILQIEGFHVRSAGDGQAGLAMVAEQRPDLILCDIMMPNMDGHSVMALLRADPTCADIPFIFVTAMGDRSEVRRGMSAGADDYLSKPFSAEELLATVTGRLNRREVLRTTLLKPALQKEFAILIQRTTIREREVLHLVGCGATSREIAQQLGITLRTVDAHRTNLMSKLGAANAALLARWAVIADQMREHASATTHRDMLE
jgi:DNA-binding NarL/FixJ family response regulator